MTTMPSSSNPTTRRRRRRLAIAGVALAVSFATAGTTFGISTSPGRSQLAIPGDRGIGGGGGGY